MPSRLNNRLYSLYRQNYHRATEFTTKVLIPVVGITVSHSHDFDRKSFSPVVVLDIYCRNSHPIDGVKYM